MCEPDLKKSTRICSDRTRICSDRTRICLIAREYVLKGYASETHSKKLHASNSKELTTKEELTRT